MLDGGGLSTLQPDCFTLGKVRMLETLGGPQSRSGRVWRRQSSTGIRTLVLPARSLVVMLTTLVVVVVVVVLVVQ